MKILIVSGIYPPDIGGPASFAFNLGQAFTLRNHEVKIVTLADKLTASSLARSNIKIYRILRKQNFFFRFLRTVIQIRIASQSVDLIICTGLHEECGLALIGRKTKAIAKVVGDPVWERAVNKKITDKTIEIFNVETKITNLKIKMQRFLLSKSLNNFELIIVPGDSIESIVKLWRLKAEVKKVSNAVVPLKKDNVKKKMIIKFDFLVVSRLVKWKRVDLAINIAAKLQKSIAVIGLGPELQSLKNYAESLGAEASFLGTRNQEEIYEISKNCFCFIQMSEYEGMSYSILEAMNAGLLVICSDIQANRDVITHLYNGILINSKSLDSSYDELRSIFSNTDLVSSMISNAKIKIESEHNISTQVNFFENFVSESTN